MYRTNCNEAREQTTRRPSASRLNSQVHFTHLNTSCSYTQQLLCRTTTTTTTRRRNACTRPHADTREHAEQREAAYRAGLFQSAAIKLQTKPRPRTLVNTQQTQINPESLRAALILTRSERYTDSPFRGGLLQRTILIVITGVQE